MLAMFLIALNRTALAQTSSAPLANATAKDLPRWRGFNLLEKFHLQWSNKPFEEDDFRMIHELGFDFVRLPMDYRVWIKDGDWTKFNEETLKEIDEVVGWGKKYSVHVCINFHRAPGYTVASPKEETDLWTNPLTQQVCAKHWSTFARRYRDIPNQYLSFNLFNEPPDEAGKSFVPVVRKMVEAIRSIDPNRLIISDGLRWGQQPVLELASLKIAQATRGYTPNDVTHYKASWMEGSDSYPVPKWPRSKAYGLIYSETKTDVAPETRKPLRLRGNFQTNTRLRFRIGIVSTKANLDVKADGQSVFNKSFIPGPGKGEWKQVNYQAQWDAYQNVYDRDYETTIPAGTKMVEFIVTEGDWLTITELGVVSGSGREATINLLNVWGQPPTDVTFSQSDPELTFRTSEMEDQQWLWNQYVMPWVNAKQQGIGVMVGEFGCYNKTPHDVTLAWMEDNLVNWKRANIGWALWNFRGEFGILDSGRDDVDYENFQGHQLDRKMLDLLQKH